jgi:putative component of toxin-antitoxin plasmid stabilization module
MHIHSQTAPKRVASEILALLLIGSTVCLATAKESVIYNKVIVSPGSVVTGNTGVIINGKKVDKGSVTVANPGPPKTVKIPCEANRMTIAVDDPRLQITRGEPCTVTLPASLAETLDLSGNTVTIRDPKGIGFGETIKLKLHTVHDITVDGDANMRIALPLDRLAITVHGDADIVIEKAVDTLHIESDGDMRIRFGKAKTVVLKSHGGDIDATFQETDALTLDGADDVTINSPDHHYTLTKKITGDLTKR